jgi:signal transduction histidine kinase
MGAEFGGIQRAEGQADTVMEKVFSRWPSQAQWAPQPESSGPEETLPGWMLTVSSRPWPERVRPAQTALAVVLVPAALVLGACLLSESTAVAKSLAAIAAGFAIIIAFAQAMKLQHSLTDSNAYYSAVFERAGISMWLEDWSAAADAVSTLRQRGVNDMEAYFATRPDELRALCGKVMIKDVNAFTLEEARVTNKELIIGPLDRLLPHTDQTFVQWLVAFAQGHRFFRSEAHITRPDGSVSDTLFTAAMPTDKAGFARIIATSLDITEYKSEQAKLLAADANIARAARISTVGALGASIAHEVNSPLAAVIANAQAALRWLQRGTPDVGEAIEAVAAIVAEATRAKDVVVRTRAFFSNSAIPAAPFDVVAAAREANLLVERELRHCGAGVHIHAEQDLPAVHGDLVQVQQVFTNLLLNAAQAMIGRLSTREITISFKRDGNTVRVDVADSGPGIDPLNLERIFDPFYTTKTDGMGMGMAICRNCIDAQGGNIWASSGPNKGATIHFTLPIHNG